MSNLFNCLFLPGLPGGQKEYRILSDIKKSGGNLIWQTYTGSYERVDVGVFNLENCLQDIRVSLARLRSDNLPYVLIAYSFSSYLIQQLSAEELKGCEAIYIYSPIISFHQSDISSDFYALINLLDRTGTISADSSEWETAVLKKGSVDTLVNWFDSLQACNVPVFCFSSEGDPESFSPKVIQRLTGHFKNKSSSIFILQLGNTSHTLDSYYDTVARSFMWAIIAKITIEYETGITKHYYIWGSMLDMLSWSRYSDIDLLLIADFSPELYATFAKTVRKLEAMSGIHVGFSVNKPIDLQRTSYIRQNRGAIFLHELDKSTIPLSGKLATRKISQAELKQDALNTNLILRAEIEKQLLKYHDDISVTQKVCKSFLQAYRLLQYGRGSVIADYKNLHTEEENLKRVVEQTFHAKCHNYPDVDFNQLLEIYDAMNNIIDEQEELLGNE